jgi:hypothetical protein
MTLIILSKATTSLVNNINSVAQDDGTLLGNRNLSACKNKRIGLKQSDDKKHDIYLNTETISKMVLRLLVETQMLEEELAKVLGIDVRNLKQLCSLEATQALIAKINLPLIRLYCKADFKSNI